MASELSLYKKLGVTRDTPAASNLITPKELNDYFHPFSAQAVIVFL